MMLALQLLVIGVVCWSVLGESEEWSEVSNPCTQFRCAAGSVCVPIVNDLLQMPVAHCVEDETTNNIGEEDNEQCSEYDVGASIVTCRTESEWKQAGTNKCSLFSATATVEVHYPCHRSRSDSPPIFLQATISCCPDKATTVQYHDTEITPVTYSDTFYIIDEDVIVRGEEKGSGEGSVETWIIVTFGGCAILIGVAIVTLKILHYRRSKRNSSKKPKLSFVTAYVNPSSDGWGEDGANEGLKDGEYGKVDLSSYITSNSSVVEDTYY